jgi:hypothetical protein
VTSASLLRSSGAAALGCVLLVSGLAAADPPLPPLPPPPDAQTPPTVTPTAVTPTAPPPTPGSPASPSALPTGEPRAPAEVPPPQPYTYATPPKGPPELSLADPKHAPAFALWLGGNVGFLAYSGNLYIRDQTTGDLEGMGNFVRPGVALQGDVGARLARRYIPYFTVELGLVPAGRRFDGGPSTTASTSFVGIGFRYLMGDVDWISIPLDVSFGWRKFQVSNATGTWSAGGLEILRLGVGVDIRLSTRATISPMLTLAGGTLTDTGGQITFADGTAPPYIGNAGIPPDARTTYFAVVVGCGVHADLFGR